MTLAHVLFLFHFRSILIVTLPLPLAILSSFLLMRVFGITSNIMSLGGIAIAIGVLVDAGIVITENVFRHYEADGGRKPIVEVVRDACQADRPADLLFDGDHPAGVPARVLADRRGRESSSTRSLSRRRSR